MSIKKFNPNTVVKPFNNAYHHCVVIPPNAETLFISGQLGLNLDGTLPQDPQLEADKAWENVIECVQEAGMGTEDIVKITAILLMKEIIRILQTVGLSSWVTPDQHLPQFCKSPSEKRMEI